MMVTMTYMLGCSTRDLAMTPMDGYLSWGIHQSLKIQRRYTITLIVSTGRYGPILMITIMKSYKTKTKTSMMHASASTNDDSNDDAAVANDEPDDAAITHRNTIETATPRFPSDMTIYENEFP